MIEVIIDDELEPATEAEDPISLHALTGIHPRSGKTIQLLVVVKGVQLHALLDSGSTHNFIDSAAEEQRTIPF
jgi:hypothetical protein